MKLKTNISQGIVAMCFRCGGICNANLPLNVAVKKNLKKVSN